MEWQSKWSRSLAKWQPKWKATIRSCLLVDNDCFIDKDARYTGTVSTYLASRGYGFIELDQKDIVPNDRVWVYQANIATEGPPRGFHLVKGQEVEFGVTRFSEGKASKRRTTLRAVRVTQSGGASFAVPDEVKTYVGGSHTRYTGTLRSYNPRQRCGWVVIDEGHTSAFKESVPAELKVEEKELNCGGSKPREWLENMSVEFGIVRSKAFGYLAENVSLPGGLPIQKQRIESRQLASQDYFYGSVTSYHKAKGWGYIWPDNAETLPASVQANLAFRAIRLAEKGVNMYEDGFIYFRKEDVAGDCWIDEQIPVKFKVYMDSKGVGACDVMSAMAATEEDLYHEPPAVTSHPPRVVRPPGAPVSL